jgi:hypothetical protein
LEDGKAKSVEKGAKVKQAAILTILLVWSFGLFACQVSVLRSDSNAQNKTKIEGNKETKSELETESKAETGSSKVDSNSKADSLTPGLQTSQQKTVRDFFNLLPQKYFTLEGCADNPTRKNCDNARTEYLKNYLEVEDAANGYMKGGCDGAQSCFEMALFKRLDGTYIIGLTTLFEAGEDSYFLEYADGKWKDIGAQVVPEYAKNKVYELPRYGTTIKVFELKKVEENFSERGGKPYDLVWKDGRFSIKR